MFGRADVLSHVGFIRDIQKTGQISPGNIYPNFHLLVLSLSYAMPTKSYEYLACGVPVVVTGRGEVARSVAASGGGRHAEVDAEDIAAALDELLEAPDRRRRFGASGREHVADRYDRAGIADELDELLSGLVGADAGNEMSQRSAVQS